MTMHNLYRKMMAEYYMNSSKSTQFCMKSFFRKLPDPEELTREWILDFLMSYENKKTRSTFFTYLKVTCKRLKRPELMDGIIVKEPRPNVTRADLLTPKEIHKLLIAAEEPMMKAVIELLVESGCRIGELLSLTRDEIGFEKVFSTTLTIHHKGRINRPLLFLCLKMPV